MSAVHVKILKLLREAVVQGQNPLGQTILNTADDMALRTLFRSYRGTNADNARGLRLSDLGLQLMKCYFKPFEIALSADHKINAQYLIFLERKARLPYHYGQETMVLFETVLGLQLKLADGNLQTLIDILP